MTEISPASGKATDAGAPVRIPLHLHLRQDRFSKRRDSRVLRLVPDDAHHDRALHRGPIHRVRTREEVHESPGRLLALIAHRGRRRRRWCGCGVDDPARRCKNALTDTRDFDGFGDPSLPGHVGRAQGHLATRWDARVFEGPHTARGHAHAEQCAVLALV